MVTGIDATADIDRVVATTQALRARRRVGVDEPYGALDITDLDNDTAGEVGPFLLGKFLLAGRQSAQGRVQG